jgi:hypothetical protein
MIIKRWNAGTTAWVEHYPKTTANQIFDTAGTTAVFDNNNKIKPAYLPDSVFDSLMFDGTASLSDGNARDRAASMLPSAFFANRSLMGYYKVVSSAFTLEAPTGTELVTLSNTSDWGGNSGQPVLTAAASGAGKNYRPGIFVEGTGIPLGTTILLISASGDTITLSNDLTENVTPLTTVSFKTYMKADISFGEESNSYTRTFTLTTGSATVTGGNTSYLKVGMRVIGTGVPTNGVPTIVSINANGTTFVMSAAAISPGGQQSLTFEPTTNPGSVKLETGDWFVVTKFSGTGTIGNPYYATFGIVNNTYEIMKPASASLAGAPGLVPAPLAGEQGLYLRADGDWGTPTNTTYGIATTSTAGLVELFHDKITTALTVEAAGTTAGRYYGVRLNNEDQMIVNVPWVNTTYLEATEEVSGLVETAHAKLTANITIATAGTTSDRYYGVRLNNGGQMVVNVPWENTTYNIATTTTAGLVELAHDKITTALTVATATTTSDRYYGVRLNNDNQMIVNVPWQEYTASVGLGLSSGAFSMNQPHVVSAAEPATTFRKDNTLWFDI